MKPNKKIMFQHILSALITLVGIVLLIFMVTVESEPGLIPLLLITLGIGLYFFTRYKVRSKTVNH